MKQHVELELDDHEVTMPEPRHWYLIAYDVSEPRALRRVHKTLSAWGKPVQLSLFRTRCTERELEQLRFEITKIIDGASPWTVTREAQPSQSRMIISRSACRGEKGL